MFRLIKFILTLFFSLIISTSSVFAEEEIMGIGVKLIEKDSRIYIAEVFNNSPAEEVGLQKDDEIVKVNGEVLKNQVLDEVVSKIKGKKDTTVELTVKTDSGIKDYNIKRTYDALYEVIVAYMTKLINNNEYEKLLVETNKYLQSEKVQQNKALLALIYIQRGISRYQLKDYYAGYKEFEKSTEVLPCYYSFLGMGNCALADKQYQLALECYIISIRLKKHNPEAFEGKAYALKGLGKYKEYYENLDYAKEQYLQDGNTTKYKQMINYKRNY